MHEQNNGRLDLRACQNAARYSAICAPRSSPTVSQKARAFKVAGLLRLHGLDVDAEMERPLEPDGVELDMGP
jgi:hypothetical protein